ncbi:NADH dehydrogenase [ubiquinone] 1 beta subcomplex subunit 9 [Colletotrichum tanaceti]|nr:NADH dehydrogenase [ubiquinone] 1 beta subcomplex subunit 9 [Colletotrichum tanaceti]
MSTRQAALSLYRRSLKLALDWAVHRHLWRGQALYIRSLFEANRNELLAQTENLLAKWKHPEPYVHPTAPGGSKYERNLRAPILDREFCCPMFRYRANAIVSATPIKVLSE